MKYVFLILFFSVACFASEILITLEEKVDESSLVVVGTVTTVRLGEIKKEKGQFLKTQKVIITLKIDEYIYGNAENEINIICYSVFYTDKDGSIAGATAGFSSYGIAKDNRYIAYLEQVDGKYYLSGSSNQYLEIINDANNTVNDIGQTSKMVPLDKKIRKLRKLAKSKSKIKKEKGNNKNSAKR